MSKTTVFDVAEWFLAHQRMTHKKLQKMVYYAYAWYYTLTGKKLFDGEFEAWIHGPVNRKLYGRYAGNGWNEIAGDDSYTPRLSEEEEDFLKDVQSVFGKYSADELESMTHQEEPWIKARNGIPSNQSCCAVIDDEVMRQFYGNMAHQSQLE